MWEGWCGKLVGAGSQENGKLVWSIGVGSWSERRRRHRQRHGGESSAASGGQELARCCVRPRTPPICQPTYSGETNLSNNI